MAFGKSEFMEYGVPKRKMLCRQSAKDDYICSLKIYP